MSMEKMFLHLFNMSITAGYLVLAVMVLRLLLKKAPKWITGVLWAFVALRLIFPFSIESILSLIPSAETVPPDIVSSPLPQIHSGIPMLNSTVNPIISESLAPKPINSVNPMQVIVFVATVLWLLGVLAMATYAFFSFILLRKKVKERVKLDGNIYVCDNVPTPFILGVFRPKIYLPSNIKKEDETYVISHEKAHLKRCDQLWKPLGFLLLTIYWFNPLLWVGYVLLCRDIELACDERVLRECGSEIKKEYSTALVNCSLSKKALSACPLAFGEVGVKQRIKSVLNYKKPAFWIILVAILSCVAVAVFFLTNPQSDDIANKKFNAKELIVTCDAGHIMETEDAPLYEINESLELYETQNDVRNFVGKFEKISLEKGDFEYLFSYYNYRDNYYSFEKLYEIYENNKTVYSTAIGAEEEMQLRYLFVQKNGEIYIAHGFVEWGDFWNEEEGKNFIRWLYLLEPTDEKTTDDTTSRFDIAKKEVIEHDKNYKLVLCSGIYYYYIYDNSNNLVRSGGPYDSHRNPPEFEYINDNLLRVLYVGGTGILTRVSYYYDVSRNIFSKAFTGVYDQYGGYVVYPDESCKSLVIRDMFDDEGYSFEITSFEYPFGTFVEPLIDAKFINNGKSLEITYLTGEQNIEVKEIKEINLPGNNVETTTENTSDENIDTFDTTQVGGADQPANIEITEESITYVFNSADIETSTLTINTKTKDASFSLSVLSSYWAYGTYEEDGEYLTVTTTDNFKNKYTFKKDGENLIFVADKSSKMPSFKYSSGAEPKLCVPDGAVYEKKHGRANYSPIIDSIDFDIDSDGIQENCALSYGPTSGVFSFYFEVSENGREEYTTLITAPHQILGFTVVDEELKVKGIFTKSVSTYDKEVTEIKLYDIVIENGVIMLYCDGVSIGEVFESIGSSLYND